MNKYIQLAKKLGMVDAKIITPEDICFDPRTILKCKWGCDDPNTQKCSDRGLSYETRVRLVKSYRKILVIHSHNARDIYTAALEIERQAFLDGHYFAFVLNNCNFCESCEVMNGNKCIAPNKIRPCDQLFGINTYETVRKQNMEIEVLKSKKDLPNRYAYVLIE